MKLPKIIKGSNDAKRVACWGKKDDLLEAGIASWVRDHRRVGFINDSHEDGRWQPLPHQPQTIRSVLAVPILKCDELLGILTLMHPQPNHFSPEAVEQMKATSDQIAMTLENARLYGRLNESYRSLDQSKQACLRPCFLVPSILLVA